MGSIKLFTVTSIIDIIAKDPHPKNFSLPSYTYPHEARRIVVEEALSVGSSHILFLDSDMVVKGDVIQRLANHNKAVVGAMYNERRLPLTSTVKIKKDGEFVDFNTNDLPKSLFQCYAVGTGCMLVETAIFEKLEKPWFFFSSHPDGSMDYGEDVWFCDRVQKAGFSVWCDPTIEIRHIGEYGY